MSFIGYKIHGLPLNVPDNALTVTLRLSAVLYPVGVTTSRVEENIGQVPVTVERLNQRWVEQIPTP